MNKRIKNKVVFITGGANGIGKATALLFSKDNKVIVIDNDEKEEKSEDAEEGFSLDEGVFLDDDDSED